MSVIAAIDLRPGMLVSYEKKLCLVMKRHHHTPGNLRGMIQTRMRDLGSGNSFDQRFRPDERLEQVFLDRIEAEFLYEDQGAYHFMNSESFEQFDFDAETLGEVASYLLPGLKVQVAYHEGKPVQITPPNKMNLKVVECDPPMKGATVSASKKPAKTETGLVVLVPQFVNVDDVITVDTREGTYLDRA
jgi:elongation factor P